MRTWKVAALLVCLMLSTSWPAFGADKKPKVTGTFSSLTYHAEAGDLLGVEIKIVPARGPGADLRYQGALQIAEGGPSEIMVVDVLVKGDKVRFGIPNSYPTYGSKGIRGRWLVKGEPGGEEMLIRGRGYWDR